jgi:hypothetical protein
MFANSRGSEQFAILATLDPVSAAAGAATSSWVPVQNFHSILTIINTGVLGTSATLDARLQQATDSSGTGSKDVASRAITQIVKATGDNKQVLINMRTDEIDTTNAYTHVRVVVTVAVAASVYGAQVLGMNPRFAPASDANQAAVVQIVG